MNGLKRLSGDLIAHFGPLGLLAVLSLAPAAASAQAVWSQAASSKPSARQPVAMAYDSKRGVIVLFGGFGQDTRESFRGTWHWNGARWKRVSTSGPSPRQAGAIAYDSARDLVVLFGGSVCGERCRAGSHRDVDYLGDTWEWDGKRWRQVATSGPSPRQAHMVYDRARGVSLLFGGEGGGAVLGDTWEWDGESWTEVDSPGPAPRASAGMAYDSRRGVTVLFGGFGTERELDDTWEWDGESWTQVSTTGPLSRFVTAMAYDERRGVTVLFGGLTFQGTILLGDSWEWNGTTWKQVGASVPSPGRWSHAMAYDAARGQVVLFGGRVFGEIGESNTDLAETWVLGSGISSGHSDYTGNGASDLVVYNPGSGQWKIQRKRGFKFGGDNAIPVPGDYNGDDKADAAYFQAAEGVWKVRRQFTVSEFGGEGDIPAVGDYDGDGRTDLGFFRPATGTWHIADGTELERAAEATWAGASYSSGLEVDEVEFGQLGDVPVPGDYDGDGLTELAVYRPAKRRWIVQDQGSVKFGKSGSIPVPADYDGDGTTDIAVWAPSSGKWHVRGGPKATFGTIGEIPVPGDYDGNGTADFAVYDSAAGTWRVKDQFESHHGGACEIPLVRGK